MKRTRSTGVLTTLLVALVPFSLASAGSDNPPAQVLRSSTGSRPPAAALPCAACAEQTPILDSGRPPLPVVEGDGIESCTLVNTSADWAAYCDDNVVPDCPILDEAFFAQHTVVAVAVDTLTPRPCEGTPDPLWRLDCIRTPGSATVRVVKQRPGGWCRCSAMPQHLERRFLASAVPKTGATRCRVCEERQTIGCQAY